MTAALYFVAACCLLGEASGLLLPGGAQNAAGMSARRPLVPRMQQGGAQTIDGVRVGPPPDLPSLLLNNRIVYVGLPLVPSVTEVVVAQLLFLNYDNPGKEVYMYVNSPGTQGAFETEAFAIVDTMNYVAPPIETIC